MNLGHPMPESRLTENPVRPIDYEQGPVSRIIDETRSVGVYGKFRDPQSGISSKENLDRWSGRAHSNDGRDPRGRGAGSDGHLADPYLRAFSMRPSRPTQTGM
jgi:hypothetical protein